MSTLTTYPSPRLLNGWTRESLNRDDDKTAAADTEGLLHVNIDGAWMLYVPWFRGDHHAVIRHRDGSDIEAKIDANNTITTPRGRKVGPRKWYH